MTFETDCAFLVRVLADGRPHSLNDILRRSFAERGCGLTVHSRAADLRKRGYTVTNWKAGERGAGSWYRLDASPLEVAPVADAGATSSGGLPPGPRPPSGDPRPAAPLPGQTSIDDELAEVAA